MDVKTDISTGLSDVQAAELIKRGECSGKAAVSTKSIGRIFADNIFTLFNLINAVLALFVALVGSWRNMLFMGVILCNIAIGIFQEIRSKRVIDRLSLISAPKAHLLRSGQERTLPVSDIVKGDIMLLSGGRQICADGVVVQGSCEVDESLITGESDPVYKREGDELLSGSFVISGEAKAQAVRVGADSYANKITGEAKKAKKRDSYMMRSINRIIGTISVCIVPFALVLFFKAIFITGQTLGRGVVSTVAALIGMIPEGLVLLTSLALAVSSIKLARHKALCQELFCVESLAGADVLCLDKTGTITEGTMEVTETVSLDEDFDCGGALNALAAVLPDHNPTLAAVQRRFSEGTALRCDVKVPFSSERKWSAAHFEGAGTFILGAPEFILPEEELPSVKRLAEKYSADGMRVLLLAHSESAPPESGKPERARSKALVILSDKIRETAPQTFEYFRKQGVTLKVISGDDPVTVSSIAGKAGLEGADSSVDASKLSDEELYAAAEKYTVFGRVTPQRKLGLVKALKQNGHRVAMTGDGVNDVLALKNADCSIAMQSGSDAARCVSQLVLLDSDFATMPLIVEEGRRCINNIRRSAALFLVKTIFSFLLAVTFLFIPAAYPFQPIQMTLISAITIGIPSFLLALEPDHGIVRGSFISAVLKKAFPGGAAVVIGIILLLAAQSVFDIPQERLSVMATLMTGASGFAVLFNICRPFNKARVAMLTALIVMFSGAAAFFGEIFFIVPLNASEWLILAVLTALVWLIRWLLCVTLPRLPAGKTPVISHKVKRIIVGSVFALSAVFALWFSIVLTDYFALAGGNEPVIARRTSGEAYEGLFYKAENGELTVFGITLAPAEVTNDL